MIKVNHQANSAARNPLSNLPYEPTRLLQNNILPLQNEKVDYSSIYTQNYIKHDPTANKVTKFDIINKNYIFPQEKFSGQSNYSGSYKNTTDSRAKVQKVNFAENQVIPKGKFQGNSSYLENYINSQTVRRQPVKHEGQLKLGGKFEGSSSYADNYASKGMIERQQKITFVDNKILPEGKFDNTSTYAGNYVANPIQMNPQIRKEGQLKVGGKFQGSSSYAADYDQKNNGQIRREKIQFKDNQIMPKGGFEGDSTYQSNYISNEKFTPSKLFRQPEQLKVGGEFYGSSNYAANFDNKGFEGRRQKAIIPQNKIFTQGRFDDSTTYTGNYVQNPIQRKQLYKPQGQLKINGGAFNGSSSYGDDYIKHINQGRQKTVSYPVNDVIPKGSFNGTSTYGDNYIPSIVQRRQQIHPSGNIKIGGKFEGNSNYTENYDGGVAPAKYLNRQNDYHPTRQK